MDRLRVPNGTRTSSIFTVAALFGGNLRFAVPVLRFACLNDINIRAGPLLHVANKVQVGYPHGRPVPPGRFRPHGGILAGLGIRSAELVTLAASRRGAFNPGNDLRRRNLESIGDATERIKRRRLLIVTFDDGIGRLPGKARNGLFGRYANAPIIGTVFPVMKGTAVLADRLGTLIEVRRTQCRISFEDRNWTFPRDRIKAHRQRRSSMVPSGRRA